MSKQRMEQILTNPQSAAGANPLFPLTPAAVRALLERAEKKPA